MNCEQVGKRGEYDSNLSIRRKDKEKDRKGQYYNNNLLLRMRFPIYSKRKIDDS